LPNAICNKFTAPHKQPTVNTVSTPALKEAPVYVVRQGLFVDVRLGGRIVHFAIDFPNQFIHVDLMDRRKEGERLARAVLTATTFESMAVKDASRVRTAFYNLSHAYVFVDRVHRFTHLACR
jgi:hypothetical protein